MSGIKGLHNTTIGIIGGGQLGRMFIENALALNVDCAVLDPDPNCPSAGIATHFITGSLNDAAAIGKLAAVSDVLTYEIEHINTAALIELESRNARIIPSPGLLRIIQDKGLQKKFFEKHSIPTAPFKIVSAPAEWADAARTIGAEKFAAKKCREGYDGKGVSLLTVKEIENDPSVIPFRDDTVIEKFIACSKELAVMVGRDLNGNSSCFPVVEMEFDQEANLVSDLLCPAAIPEDVAEEARKIALNVVEKMEGVGIFAIEMFLDHNNKIYVNEVAPRPHNSGHHTIEGCYTSQYEQLLRILLGLPLGDTTVVKPSVMINLLGGEGFSGPYRLNGIEKILKETGVYIHLYGKKESRPKRKLGHITILGDTPEEARNKAAEVKSIVSIVTAG
jgi:5-(carboxyamino)imidazole ribonucleotide synthase